MVRIQVLGEKDAAGQTEIGDATVEAGPPRLLPACRRRTASQDKSGVFALLNCFLLFIGFILVLASIKVFTVYCSVFHK